MPMCLSIGNPFIKPAIIQKMSTFGERLRQARKAAKMSQEKIANLVGVKQATISELEAEGKGSTHTAIFAKHLNYKPQPIIQLGQAKACPLIQTLGFHVTTPKTLDHLPVFEKLGEAQVRLQFIDRTDDVGREARSWLHELQLQRDLEASAKRDAREEETLSIAKEANRLASEANTIARLEAASASRSARYAMHSAVIAAIMAIITAKTEIYALILKSIP